MSAAGRVIAERYELAMALGRGGMGEVFQARDRRLERIVAVKLLRTDMSGDPDSVTRFRREAQAAAGMKHPRIVAVYDFGEQPFSDAAGVHLQPYIVMEFVEGDGLHTMLEKGGAMPPTKAIQIAAGVLTGLAHAHERGVIHRDIKPANVVIEPSGSAKVMDFGIARAGGQAASGLTSNDLILGTAYDMSPEQASGEAVDGRTDLYSVGCVFYEMLTGRRPFVGETPLLTMSKHLSDTAVPPSQLVSGLNPEFDRVMATALAKDPAWRYPDAGAFLADLAALAGKAPSGQQDVVYRIASAPPRPEPSPKPGTEYTFLGHPVGASRPGTPSAGQPPVVPLQPGLRPPTPPMPPGRPGQMAPPPAPPRGPGNAGPAHGPAGAPYPTSGPVAMSPPGPRPPVPPAAVSASAAPTQLGPPVARPPAGRPPAGPAPYPGVPGQGPTQQALPYAPQAPQAAQVLQMRPAPPTTKPAKPAPGTAA
ncbi:MAG: protein kinase, partial [Bifidobacteriaceae bacterium]|nr:protein kinase [Bifidobacteriaceae bacterium]